jgi:hypothetical protein
MEDQSKKGNQIISNYRKNCTGVYSNLAYYPFKLRICIRFCANNARHSKAKVKSRVILTPTCQNFIDGATRQLAKYEAAHGKIKTRKPGAIFL